MRVTGLLLVLAVAAVVCDQLLAPASSTTPSPVRVPREPPPRADGTLGFAGGTPGVANLDPALRRALRRAAIDAASEGIELRLDSGWRSPAYQQQLLDEAVLKYGSEEEAARWVATPETSAHVSGDAADVGPPDAAAWLSEHGAAYGLCQIYGNEPWHYELRVAAPGDGCPPMYPDPTYDPRMRRR